MNNIPYFVQRSLFSICFNKDNPAYRYALERSFEDLINNTLEVLSKEKESFHSFYSSIANDKKANDHGQARIAKILLEHGADPNRTANKFSTTPLHLASVRGHTDVVKVLLEYKANILLENYDGKNSIYLARENGHIDIVRLLGG